MKPPGFWRHGGNPLPAALLSPVAALVAAATARRVARPGWQAPVPVICCGNPGVGGAGKTTLVLDLAERLQARGLAVHLLTRGHGGRAAGVVRVDPAVHTAREVGDEALLLAAYAPTWRGADRAAGARAAVAAGAQVLVMDDGLQNPGLCKTASFLVIDGGAGFGNGRVLPAGPLREPVRAAAVRSTAAVLIGPDLTGALMHLPAALPVLRAELAPGPELASLAGRRVLAFAGIGRPTKFFDMLAAGGAELVHRQAFADHHVFLESELRRLREMAHRLNAVAVTTPKDRIRMSGEAAAWFTVVSVGLRWSDLATLERMIDV